MSIQQIPRGEWGMFLQRFSSRHHGWLMRLERSDLRGRWQTTLAYDQPLGALSVERNSDHDTLLLHIGEGRTYRIEAPLELVLTTTQEGADQGLRVVSADGSVTHLSFRMAILPEQVDGLLEAELPATRG